MREQTNNRTDQLAVAIGWFSIGLGIAEIMAPRTLARFIGAKDDETTASVLRALGAREIGHGLSILAEPESAPRMWARVGGDAVDLGFLGAAFKSENSDSARLAGALAAVAGVAALDVFSALKLGRSEGGRKWTTGRGIRVERVTTINRPIEEVYAFWRDFANFPRFMRHLESVEVTGERRSHWRAKGPAGLSVDWDAEIVQDQENEWIAWRSLPGSDVENSGSVRFQRAPGARGTEVRVQLQYRPPAGRIGRGIAWLFGEEPNQQIHEDLHRFKQLMETGDVPLSDGPGLWRPAQPAAKPEEITTLAGVQR